MATATSTRPRPAPAAPAMSAALADLQASTARLAEEITRYTLASGGASGGKGPSINDRPGNPSDALADWELSIQGRLGLQSDVTWTGLNDGYTAAGGADPASKYAVLWWTLGPVKTHHCFPAGTPISVPGGVAPIEAIRVGDMVQTLHGPRRVTRLYRNEYHGALQRVRADGHSVLCTPNHPFLTQRGWVAAEDLRLGDKAVLTQDGAHVGVGQFRLPDTDDGVTQRVQRGVLGYVAFALHGLALRQACDARVAVPVVSVSLNDDGADAYVHEVLPVNQHGRLIGDAKVVQQVTQVAFQFARRLHALTPRPASQHARSNLSNFIGMRGVPLADLRLGLLASHRVVLDHVLLRRIMDQPSFSGRADRHTHLARLAEHLLVRQANSLRNLRSTICGIVRQQVPILVRCPHPFAPLTVGIFAPCAAIPASAPTAQRISPHAIVPALGARLNLARALCWPRLRMQVTVATGNATEAARYGADVLARERHPALLTHELSNHSDALLPDLVTSIAQSTLVYNLEVEGEHHYIAGGFVVHNCDQCPDYAAGSPYGPPGSGYKELDATPGDGHTECGAACHCVLSYGTNDALLQQDAQAAWQTRLGLSAVPRPADFPEAEWQRQRQLLPSASTDVLDVRQMSPAQRDLFGFNRFFGMTRAELVSAYQQQLDAYRGAFTAWAGVTAGTTLGTLDAYLTQIEALGQAGQDIGPLLDSLTTAQRAALDAGVWAIIQASVTQQVGDFFGYGNLLDLSMAQAAAANTGQQFSEDGRHTFNYPDPEQGGHWHSNGGGGSPAREQWDHAYETLQGPHIERFARQRGLTRAAYEEVVTARLRQALVGTRVYVRRTLATTGLIVHDGRLKTVHETGRSGGEGDLALRSRLEETLHGQKGIVYGFAARPREATVAKMQFGEVAFEVKPHALRDATVTFNDTMNASGTSFRAGVVPTSLAHPDYRSYDYERYGDPLMYIQGAYDAAGYTEVQMPHGLSLHDVARIHFLDSFPPSADLRAAMDHAGVAYDVSAEFPDTQQLRESAAADATYTFYDPSQQRDSHGRWAGSGEGGVREHSHGYTPHAPLPAGREARTAWRQTMKGHVYAAGEDLKAAGRTVERVRAAYNRATDPRERATLGQQLRDAVAHEAAHQAAQTQVQAALRASYATEQTRRAALEPTPPPRVIGEAAPRRVADTSATERALVGHPLSAEETRALAGAPAGSTVVVRGVGSSRLMLTVHGPGPQDVREVHLSRNEAGQAQLLSWAYHPGGRVDVPHDAHELTAQIAAAHQAGVHTVYIKAVSNAEVRLLTHMGFNTSAQQIHSEGHFLDQPLPGWMRRGDGTPIRDLYDLQAIPAGRDHPSGADWFLTHISSPGMTLNLADPEAARRWATYRATAG